MPKATKTDWEKCEVDDRHSALVGAIEMDGLKQGIMLLSGDYFLNRNPSKEYGKFGAQLADQDLATAVLKALAESPVPELTHLSVSPIIYQDSNGDLKSMKLDREGRVVDVAPTEGAAYLPTLAGHPLYTVTTEVADELRNAGKKVDTTTPPATPEQATSEEPLTAAEYLDRHALEVAVKSAGFKDLEDFLRQMKEAGVAERVKPPAK
jgi:hypothetical protein